MLQDGWSSKDCVQDILEEAEVGQRECLRGAEWGLGPHGHHWQEEGRQAIEEEDGPAEEVGGIVGDGEAGGLLHDFLNNFLSAGADFVISSTLSLTLL